VLDENRWLNFINENAQIKKEFDKQYPSIEPGKVFRVIISRRDSYVRVNLYQVKSMELISEDLPAGIGKNGKNVFLIYDGSEMINRNISKEQLVQTLSTFKLTNKITFFDPKVMQFDVSLSKQIIFNYPPIDPYDTQIADTAALKFPMEK